MLALFWLESKSEIRTWFLLAERPEGESVLADVHIQIRMIPARRPQTVLILFMVAGTSFVGIIVVGSLLWNPGSGILAVESWLSNPGCGILAVGSWLRNPGGGILD